MVTRRLSAEMRERWTTALSHDPPGALVAVAIAQDALHDLDTADARIEELEAAAICDSGLRDGELAQAQATIAQQRQEVQRAICDTESVARSSNDNIIFLRDEIRKKDILLAERTEDAIVLGEKLKFCEMDNYTKGEAIEDYNQRLKEQAQKLTQQGAEIKHFHQMQLPDQSAMKAHIQECIEDAVAERDAVIAAMREAIGRTYIKEHGDGHIGWSYSCAHCGGADSIARDGGGMIVFTVHHPDKVTHKPDCIMVNTDTAQLAADHDAAVRADERRKVLALLADDGFAMTFQTTGQYRSALIRALSTVQPEEAGE